MILSIFLFFSASFLRPFDYTDQDCLKCHGKPEISQITAGGAIRSLYVDPDGWSRDIHYRGKLTCVDCHRNANPILHFREGFIDVDCARCHPEEAEEYQKNVHLTFKTITPGKELPLCYHCHTKHSILRHDDPFSSVHESNIGKTCGACHAEVMVTGILNGTSLGKLSGHRKGDIAERFDMKVCINCHFEDSAHGRKRVYKDFCSRCHDVRSKGNLVMGPMHLDDARWSALNTIGSGLLFLFLLAAGSFMIYGSRKRIRTKIETWLESLRLPPIQKEQSSRENTETDKRGTHEIE